MPMVSIELEKKMKFEESLESKIILSLNKKEHQNLAEFMGIKNSTGSKRNSDNQFKQIQNNNIENATVDDKTTKEKFYNLFLDLIRKTNQSYLSRK